MAKELIFSIDGQEYPFGIRKLDRKKLYGWKETVAVDKEHNECIKATLDATGSFVIPKGGIALGTVDSAGDWVESSAIRAVTSSGEEAPKIQSSFDAPIELLKTVPVETYLDYFIDTVYILESEGDYAALAAQIKGSGEVYQFIFSYRTDYQASDAFLIESNGTLFVLAGKKCEFEYLGLEEISEVSEEVEDDEFGDDDFDFGMM